MNIFSGKQTIRFENMQLAISLIFYLLIAAIFAIPASGQVPTNEELVEQWFTKAVEGNAVEAQELLGNQVIIHANGSTVQVSREARVQQVTDQLREFPDARIHQIELISQRDKVIVIYSLQSSVGPVSGVQGFRVESGRILEIWANNITQGVLWTWDEAVVGDTDINANTDVMRQWYEDIYAVADWDLVPEVAGPTYLRHEDSVFEMTGEEYAERLRSSFGQFGPLAIDYEVIAARDKVAVIAELAETPVFPVYVQVWRVRNGKLVESWWAPPVDQ